MRKKNYLPTPSPLFFFFFLGGGGLFFFVLPCNQKLCLCVFLFNLMQCHPWKGSCLLVLRAFVAAWHDEMNGSKYGQCLLIPRWSSFCVRQACGTLMKPLEKSSKMTSTCNPLASCLAYQLGLTRLFQTQSESMLGASVCHEVIWGKMSHDAVVDNVLQNLTSGGGEGDRSIVCWQVFFSFLKHGHCPQIHTSWNNFNCKSVCYMGWRFTIYLNAILHLLHKFFWMLTFTIHMGTTLTRFHLSTHLETI